MKKGLFRARRVRARRGARSLPSLGHTPLFSLSLISMHTHSSRFCSMSAPSMACRKNRASPPPVYGRLSKTGEQCSLPTTLILES
jgi:hypothetical protein